MISHSSYTKAKLHSRGENNELVFTRSGIFYGIEAKKVNEEQSTIEREILAIPNITFYDNYTKLMIDFSDYMNNPEKSDVQSFFKLLVNNQQFSIINGKWKNNSINQLTYDISGTYRFIKSVDDIVFAEVMTIGSYNLNVNRYDKEYFLETPYVEVSYTTRTTEPIVKNYIFNYLGKNSKNSFAYLGANIGDYIEIQNNEIRYEILSISQDNQGKEIITIAGEVKEVNKVGTPILISLYQENKNKIQLNYDNKITGKCEISKNGALIACLDNNTELQAKLREDFYNSITTQFYPNQFCSSVFVSEKKLSLEPASRSVANEVPQNGIFRFTPSIQTTQSLFKV